MILARLTKIIMSHARGKVVRVDGDNVNDDTRMRSSATQNNVTETPTTIITNKYRIPRLY